MDKPQYLETVPEQAHLLYTSIYPIRWSEMDAFVHMNNARYFTYFEQVRIDWLNNIGHEHGLTLANVSCTFKKPVVYPAKLEVCIFAGDAGRSSLNTYYQISDADKIGELYATGHGTIVWYDHANGSSVPIPDDIRLLIGA